MLDSSELSSSCISPFHSYTRFKISLDEEPIFFSWAALQMFAQTNRNGRNIQLPIYIENKKDREVTNGQTDTQIDRFDGLVNE